MVASLAARMHTKKLALCAPLRHACGSAASPLCARVETIILSIIVDSISNRVGVFGALAGARWSLQGLPAAAEPLQMSLRCLRPKCASGCARAAALGGGGRATLSAAIATDEMAKPSILDGF